MVADQDGNFIKTLSLGVLEPGEHTFSWDGMSESGNQMSDGTYQFQVAAVTESGNILDVDSMIQGQVTRVNLEETPPVLFVGDIPLAMSQILDIKLPEASSGTSEADGSTGQDDTESGP